MNETDVMEVVRESIVVTLKIGGPIMVLTLVVGLVISLFQALTQIQEMTLTFVPKVGLMLAVFWVTMSFMTTALSDFYLGQIIPLIAGS